MKDADGIIIDERFNYGGLPENVSNVLGRFYKDAVPFATVQTKTGPGANDFSAPQTWYSTPSAVNLVAKPVVLLTNGHSLSASDIFAMAMKNVPNEMQVGETTAGGFGLSVAREMPNGWQYAVTGSITKSMNGISYEGVGIKPDVEVSTSKADVQQRKDKQLDKALELLTKNW